MVYTGIQLKYKRWYLHYVIKVVFALSYLALCLCLVFLLVEVYTPERSSDSHSNKTKWDENPNSENLISKSSFRKSEKNRTSLSVGKINGKPLADVLFKDQCLWSGRQHEERAYGREDFDFLQTEEGRQYKTILAFHYVFNTSIGFGYGSKAFEAGCCKEKRCFMTNRTDKIPAEDFDAIMFQFFRLDYSKLPLRRRKRKQRWIFFDMESPVHTNRFPERFNGIFNWTMTYRRDSDIYYSYGNLYPRNLYPTKDLSKIKLKEFDPSSVMGTKTKMAAWMVSHCETSSMREYFVQELRNYIQVDVFGTCGSHKCPKEKRDHCYDFLANTYKFYLSFENSLCNDYISEKFYFILRYNIVPIVRGSGDYASIAPPHSFIDVRDFESVEKLADYLNYLDKNDTAYMEYLMWKKDYITSESEYLAWTHFYGSFCALCAKLHADREEKIYNDLKDWFWDKAQCIEYNLDK